MVTIYTSKISRSENEIIIIQKKDLGRIRIDVSYFAICNTFKRTCDLKKLNNKIAMQKICRKKETYE